MIPKIVMCAMIALLSGFFLGFLCAFVSDGGRLSIFDWPMPARILLIVAVLLLGIAGGAVAGMALEHYKG